MCDAGVGPCLLLPPAAVRRRVRSMEMSFKQKSSESLMNWEQEAEEKQKALQQQHRALAERLPPPQQTTAAVAPAAGFRGNSYPCSVAVLSPPSRFGMVPVSVSWRVSMAWTRRVNPPGAPTRLGNPPLTSCPPWKSCESLSTIAVETMAPASLGTNGV